MTEEIVTLGNELLRTRAEPFERPDGCGDLAARMIDIMHQGKGVGLAGPQIGLGRRIFVVHAEGDMPRVFINPSILETSQDRVRCEEGCLSVPGIWAEVERPSVIKIQAWNEKGRAFTMEAGGILSRIIQHEYDHLEGILFIDRLSELKRKRILDRLAKRKKA